MEKFTRAVKVNWVKALTSGRYKQGHGHLCDGGTYCCLGVLGRVRGEISKDGSWEGMFFMPPTGASGLTPEQETALSQLNDDGVPFDLIAGFIQENIEAES